MRVENPAVHYFLLLPALWYNFQSVADKPGIFWYIHPPILRHLPDSVRCSSEATAAVSIGTTPACTTRAIVISCAILLYVPEASITANTLYPSATALMAGKAIQTLVIVPAMISVLRPVAFTACTKSALSRALISLYARHIARGAHSHGFPESADHSVPVVRMR